LFNGKREMHSPVSIVRRNFAAGNACALRRFAALEKQQYSARLVANAGFNSIGFGSINIASHMDGGGAPGAGLFTNARIGAVVVGGDWRAADLVAGAAAGADNFFGTADDIVRSDNGSTLIAAIARITIKGSVLGTAAAGDHFGFVAEKLGKLKIAGAVVALTPGPRNDLDGVPLGATVDFGAREVA